MTEKNIEIKVGEEKTTIKVNGKVFDLNGINKPKGGDVYLSFWDTREIGINYNGHIHFLKEKDKFLEIKKFIEGEDYEPFPENFSWSTYYNPTIKLKKDQKAILEI